jgi:hypothetical protein
MAGRPTPTQAENDRAALGEYVHEHEDDGSGPDPFEEANAHARAQSHLGSKALERKPAAAPQAYATRQVKPASG